MCKETSFFRPFLKLVCVRSQETGSRKRRLIFLRDCKCQKEGDIDCSMKMMAPFEGRLREKSHAEKDVEERSSRKRKNLISCQIIEKSKEF